MAEKVLSVGEIQEIASGQRNWDWDFAKQQNSTPFPTSGSWAIAAKFRRALVPLAANLPAHGRRSVRDLNKVRTLGVRFAHQSA
jgi:hypothetical protein